jgi:hypothetical protein
MKCAGHIALEKGKLVLFFKVCVVNKQKVSCYTEGVTDLARIILTKQNGVMHLKLSVF